MNELRDLLRGMATEDGTNREPEITLENEIEVLKGQYEAFNKHYDFKPGMIVRQKRGCAYTKPLGTNGVSIVTELLKQPAATTTAAALTFGDHWR